MSRFEGLAEAQNPGTAGAYASPGEYQIEVTKCLSKDTQNHGWCFIVEGIYLTTNNEDHRAGDRFTWLQKLQNKQIGFSAMKGFFYAALGASLEARDKEKRDKIDAQLDAMADAACGEQNLLKGRKANLEVIQKPTKAGGVFSRHNWSPYTGT